MSARYNEIDPHAAEWLRNLIGLGELPDGVVDERSIVDVRGDDLAGYDELHFFAGIGVWARAVAEAEKATGHRLARPLFTGSCPCQPLSVAGPRKGHVDERHLWPAFHRLIAERRPATIVGEQVAGKDGREWMAAVRHDLEASGYAVGTAILPAGGFGAPHIRYRLFFVAHADGMQPEQFAGQRAGTIEAAGWRAHGELAGRSDAGGLADATNAGRKRRRASEAGAPQEPSWIEPERLCDAGGLADAARDVRGNGRDVLEAQQEAGGLPCEGRVGRPVVGGRRTGGLAHADEGQRGWRAGGEGDERDGTAARWLEGDGFAQAGGVFGGLADAGERRGRRIDGKQSRGGRIPADNRKTGGLADAERASAPDRFWSDADWIFCRDNKWRPIEPGSFPLVDGDSFRVGLGGPYEGMSRAGMLRGYGNAICLPVAIAFVKACLETTSL